jgi:hypothetical protein
MSQRPITEIALLVKFKAFTVVTMKDGFFWDVTPCGSRKNYTA